MVRRHSVFPFPTTLRIKASLFLDLISSRRDQTFLWSDQHPFCPLPNHPNIFKQDIARQLSRPVSGRAIPSGRSPIARSCARSSDGYCRRGPFNLQPLNWTLPPSAAGPAIVPKYVPAVSSQESMDFELEGFFN